MKNIEDKKRITLKEAANLLQELGICRALREGKKINGPNCYRFGRKDPVAGSWTWDVPELLEIARKKRSASASLINEVAERYRLRQIASTIERDAHVVQVPGSSRPIRVPSRADLEKSFRDDVRTLEALMKQMNPVRRGLEDRRTLGSLIAEHEKCGLLQKLEASEAKLVNSIRNALNHPNLGDVHDDLLRRGIESVGALICILQGNKEREK